MNGSRARAPLLILAVVLAVTFISVDFAPVLIKHRDAAAFHVEQRERKLQIALMRECKSFYPTSPANQIRCLNEMNAEQSR